MRRLAPGFEAIHELDAQGPEECIALTAYTLRSPVFHTMYRLPGYERWLDREDQEPVYRFERALLGQLGADGPARRWVLKAPPHLFSLEALLAVFPDAAVIQTHRDPVSVIGSTASLTAVMHSVFSNRVEPRELGRQTLDRWARAAEAAMGARGRLPAQRILDLTYADLVADPIGAIRGLYRAMGRHLGREAEDRMRALLSAQRAATSAHRYRLEDFGLDRAAVRSRFERYMEWFDIAPEGPGVTRRAVTPPLGNGAASARALAYRGLL